MGVLSKLYNTKYLGVLDIEFQTNLDRKQNVYILELGIIIFEQNNDTPILIDHVNFPFLHDTNLRLINSKYCTVTEQTEHKIKELEKEFQINVKDIESIKSKSELISFIPDKNTRKKLRDSITNNSLQYTDIEFSHMQKVLDKLSFNLFKNRLSPHYKKIYNQIVNLYLNDPLVKKRTINPYNYLNTLKKYFLDITIIHKEDMDFIAINNDLKKYNVPIHKSVFHKDIAAYNNILLKQYNTAKLYESYLYLYRDYSEKHSDLKQFDKELKNALQHKMSSIKAHNPLSDAYFTIIVFIIMKKYFIVKNS